MSGETAIGDKPGRSASTNMALGGALSLARLISGLVRIKIVALSLGVGGVGIFSLLLQANLTGTALVSMSMTVPIINLGRPNVARGDFKEAGALAGTALAIVSVNAILLVIVAAVLGDNFLHRIAPGELDPRLVWPVVLAIVLSGFGTSIWEGLSFLSNRFDAYVRVGIASTVADTAVTAAAAWLYGLRGAIIAMPVAAIVLVTAYALLLRRDPIVRQVLRHLSFRLAQLPRLLTYSAIMFLSIGLTNVGLTFARTKVLIAAGAGANGNLQTATALSAYILAFVTTGFWGHLHARAAAEGDTPEIRAELGKALRLGLLIAFTGCGLAATLAAYLVPLFYSGQFTGAVPLVVAYMPGEICFQLFSLLTAYQITISRRRRYLAWNLGYIGLLVLVGFVAVPRFGAAGYVVAHIAAAVTMLAITATTSWRIGQVRASVLGLAAALVACMALTSAGLLYLHAHDAPKPMALIGLVPFIVSGLLVLRQLLRESGWMPAALAKR